MPPGQAQEVGKQIISNDDNSKDLHNIPPTAVESEFGDITKEKWTDIKEFGKLEGRKGSSPHIGLGDGCSGKGCDTDRWGDI